MEPGRLYDGDGSVQRATWSKRPAHKGLLVFLGLVSAAPDGGEVVVYRCVSCGYLESYAPRK